MTTHKTLQFRSQADGLTIHGDMWIPEAKPIAALQIAHGLAEHCRRYDRVARQLTDHGFIVYAHDHRGHGRSLTGPGALGDAGKGGWNGLVSDVVQHNAAIRNAHPGLPVYLLGHSMGSFAAQQVLLDHSRELDGAILSGSTDFAMVAQLVASTGQAPSFDAYNAAFAPNRTAFDWLSRDEEEVDAYIDDPLCGFDAPEAFIADMMAAAPQLGDPDRVAGIRPDLPLYVFAGDRDPLNAGLALLHSLTSRYEAAGLKDITTKYYADGRHEMLNETNHHEVAADLIGWLESHLPG